MCLVKIEETARVATEPLKVYKILTSDNLSPFQYQWYHVGKNTASNRDILSSAGRTIDGGYLHAYMTEAQASENLSRMRNTFGFTILKVVEMYIPAGTEYWLGEGSEVAAECLYWPDTNLPAK